MGIALRAGEFRVQLGVEITGRHRVAACPDMPTRSAYSALAAKVEGSSSGSPGCGDAVTTLPIHSSGPFGCIAP
jgi:hypothetical protein